MAENTAIEWADSTFNPWSGCTKVSEACRNCYAEALAKRFPHLGGWGPGAPRKRTSEANWKKPLAWNRKAIELERVWQTADLSGMNPHGPPRRPRVFCASLADWLDPEVPAEWLADLLDIVDNTRHLDWLLLTKRPHLWRERLEAVCEWNRPERTNMECPACFWLEGDAPRNVWVGCTVEDQASSDERRPHLLAIPATVRFISYEPALGPVDWMRFFSASDASGEPSGPAVNPDGSPAVGWLICGGESGHGARPMHPAWARAARDACQEAGVAFHFKQFGEYAPGRVAGAPVTHIDESGDFDCGGQVMSRVGKKIAGRLLDGRTWDDVPRVIA